MVLATSQLSGQHDTGPDYSRRVGLQAGTLTHPPARLAPTQGSGPSSPPASRRGDTATVLGRTCPR